MKSMTLQAAALMAALGSIGSTGGFSRVISTPRDSRQALSGLFPGRRIGGGRNRRLLYEGHIHRPAGSKIAKKALYGKLGMGKPR